MNNKELLADAITTLAYSWGSDTPPEVFWGLNDLIDFLNAEYHVSIPKMESEDGEAIEKLLNDIDNLL